MKNKTLREENGVDTLSQCPHCISMTKTTISGICGKCGGHKAKIGSGIPLNNSTLRERFEKEFGFISNKGIQCDEITKNKILTFIEQEQARVLEGELVRLEGERKNNYKNFLIWLKYELNEFEGKCNQCGGQLAEIRGRFPKQSRRKVCPTCLMEIIESARQNTQEPCETLSKIKLK